MGSNSMAGARMMVWWGRFDPEMGKRSPETDEERFTMHKVRNNLNQALAGLA